MKRIIFNRRWRYILAGGLLLIAMLCMGEIIPVQARRWQACS